MLFSIAFTFWLHIVCFLSCHFVEFIGFWCTEPFINMQTYNKNCNLNFLKNINCY